MSAITRDTRSAAASCTHGGIRGRVGWLGTVLVLAPLLLAFGGTFFFAATDPDYWWHARTGQLISETGHLPTTDIYSFASADRPWVTHEWLTELLLYQIEHRAGYVANVALFAVLGAAAWPRSFRGDIRDALGLRDPLTARQCPPTDGYRLWHRPLRPAPRRLSPGLTTRPLGTPPALRPLGQLARRLRDRAGPDRAHPRRRGARTGPQPGTDPPHLGPRARAARGGRGAGGTG
jgi:hypothetical protein